VTATDVTGISLWSLGLLVATGGVHRIVQPILALCPVPALVSREQESAKRKLVAQVELSNRVDWINLVQPA